MKQQILCNQKLDRCAEYIRASDLEPSNKVHTKDYIYEHIGITERHGIGKQISDKYYGNVFICRPLFAIRFCLY